MTLDARKARDRKITQHIRRVTLDGVDLAICDVYYLDTRRGVVRSYVSDRLPSGARVFSVVAGTRGPELAKREQRGKVRYWLKQAVCSN